MLKRIAIASIVLALVATGAAFAAGLLTGTKVTLHATSRGKRLATITGRTLYLYTSDTATKSNCTAACAQSWPPLLTTAKPVAGAGVSQMLLGTIKRGTKLQVKYNGHPLYRFTGDTSAGQTRGEGLGGFYSVTAAGKKG